MGTRRGEVEGDVSSEWQWQGQDNGDAEGFPQSLDTSGKVQKSWLGLALLGYGSPSMHSEKWASF